MIIRFAEVSVKKTPQTAEGRTRGSYYKMRNMLIAIVLSASFMLADDIHTGELLNGRIWISAPSGQKTMYLSGVNEGLSGCQKPDIFPLTMTIGEIQVALDAFYTDSTNLSIPLKSALLYTKLKSEGASPKELTEMAATMRKDAFARVKPNQQ